MTGNTELSWPEAVPPDPRSGKLPYCRQSSLNPNCNKYALNFSIGSSRRSTRSDGRCSLKCPSLTCVLLPVALLSATTFGQSSVTSQQTKDASQTDQITKFFIAQPPAGSGYETGPLHVIYSDGTETVQTLPPLKASTDKEIVSNAVGFSGVELAQDRKTLGWTINVENCCTSYSIPLSVVVLQHKRVLHTFDQGQMVWGWMFLEGGKQVAVV